MTMLKQRKGMIPLSKVLNILQTCVLGWMADLDGPFIKVETNLRGESHVSIGNNPEDIWEDEEFSEYVHKAFVKNGIDAYLDVSDVSFFVSSDKPIQNDLNDEPYILIEVGSGSKYSSNPENDEDDSEDEDYED